MYTSNYTYWHDRYECRGFLAYDNNNSQPRPAVLVVHDWTGCDDFACQKAQLLAKMGYVGFAIDMYGQGV
jgi:dienelactone hydrolase